jgi:hypothetical protein
VRQCCNVSSRNESGQYEYNYKIFCDVTNHWMTLKKKENTLIWRTKH